MAKYRKKPVVIEAIQYTGNNIVEIIKFMQERANGDKSRYLRYNTKKGEYFIPTLEGEYKLTEGDYVICGIKGEFYPCKQDIFEQTYEKADSKNLNHRSKECIQYIAKITGVDEETVIKVFQAEDEYIKYILKVISGEKTTY
jgi:hypothetical protein